MKDADYPLDTAHIGRLEAAVLLILLISAKIFLNSPRLMAITGGTAGWLAVTIAAATAFVGYLSLDVLLARFPGQDLIGIARRLTGRGALLLGLIFFLFFLTDTASITRMFAESFVIGILPNTPISIISGFLVILLIAASYFGLETVSRLAMLFAPYLLLFLALIFFAVLPDVDALSITPIWGRGLPAIIPGAVLKSAYFGEIILLGFLTPFLREQKYRRRIGITAMSASYLLLLGIVLLLEMVFDYPGVTRIIFPIYHLARLITYLEFFQRVEAVFVFLWFFTAGIALSALFFAAAQVLKRALSLSSHRPLLFPLGVLVFALSFVPDSYAQTSVWNEEILQTYGWIPAFILPLLLLGAAWLKGEKGGEQS